MLDLGNLTLVPNVFWGIPWSCPPSTVDAAWPPVCTSGSVWCPRRRRRASNPSRGASTWRPCLMIYPLVIQQLAMENGPFIDGLPIKNGDFHGFMIYPLVMLVRVSPMTSMTKLQYAMQQHGFSVRTWSICTWRIGHIYSYIYPLVI